MWLGISRANWDKCEMRPHSHRSRTAVKVFHFAVNTLRRAQWNSHFIVDFYCTYYDDPHLHDRRWPSLWISRPIIAIAKMYRIALFAKRMYMYIKSPNSHGQHFFPLLILLAFVYEWHVNENHRSHTTTQRHRNKRMKWNRIDDQCANAFDRQRRRHNEWQQRQRNDNNMIIRMTLATVIKICVHESWFRWMYFVRFVCIARFHSHI